MRGFICISGAMLVLYGAASYATVTTAHPTRRTSQEVILAMDHVPIDTDTAPRASSFTLADQYNHWHTYHFPRQKVSFLALADQAGSNQLEAWIQPVYARYQNTIEIHGVAALPAVPEPLRGLVRLFFKGRLQYPVLLDWESRVARQYAYQQAQAHVFIIDTIGHVRLSVVGPVEPGQLQRVFTQIDHLLQSSCRSDQHVPCTTQEP